MSGLASILAGRHEPGVFRWHTAFEVEEVRHTVEHAGWTFGYVDGWTGQTEDDFHTGVSAALAFPDYYGRNLDALWDCLADLAEPTVLLWDGWGPLARSAPQRFPQLLRVLHDRTVEVPPFTVLLRGEGPELSVASLD